MSRPAAGRGRTGGPASTDPGAGAAASASNACPEAIRQVWPSGVVMVMVQLPVSSEANTSKIEALAARPIERTVSP